MAWYEDYPDNWDEIRKAVYKRDGYTCQHCGRQGGPFGNAELHCHHIRPKSEGGTHHPRNLQTLCWRCHNAEHDHHIQRMSNLSGTSRSARSSSRSSRTPVSPGFDPESMGEKAQNLRDIFMDVSDQETSTDSVDETSTTDDGPDWEQRATEYSCPNCGQSFKRNGWFPFYHHFRECELPDERPPTLSEDQWRKLRAKIERGAKSASSEPTTIDDIAGDTTSQSPASIGKYAVLFVTFGFVVVFIDSGGSVIVGLPVLLVLGLLLYLWMQDDW